MNHTEPNKGARHERLITRNLYWGRSLLELYQQVKYTIIRHFMLFCLYIFNEKIMLQFTHVLWDFCQENDEQSELLPLNIMSC